MEKKVQLKHKQLWDLTATEISLNKIVQENKSNKREGEREYG